MAPTLPKATVVAIEHALQLAEDNNQKPNFEAIAAIFFTTYTTVSRIHRRNKKRVETGIDERKRAGPKPTIKSPEEEEQIALSIKALIEREPNYNQSDISEWAERELGIKLSQGSWSRFLKRNAVPHKQSHKMFPKSKLVVTKDVAVKTFSRKKTVVVDDGEALAVSALAQMPLPVDQQMYSSPYAQIEAASSHLMSLHGYSMSGGGGEFQNLQYLQQ